MINKAVELYRKYKEIINYLIVGGCTTLVSLGTYYGLVLTVLDPKDPVKLQAANILSWFAWRSVMRMSNFQFLDGSIEMSFVIVLPYRQAKGLPITIWRCP